MNVTGKTEVRTSLMMMVQKGDVVDHLKRILEGHVLAGEGKFKVPWTAVVDGAARLPTLKDVNTIVA